MRRLHRWTGLKSAFVLAAALAAVLVLTGRVTATRTRVNANELPAHGLIALAWDAYQQPRPGIWVVRPDGKNLRRIVGGHGFKYPRWSPDGRFIAANHGVSALWRISWSGLRTRRIGTSYEEVSWSPSGRELATVAEHTRENQEDYESVWIIRSDGSHARRILARYNTPDPDWSPDGKRIVVTGPPTEFRLYTVDTAGKHRVAIGAHGFEPRWSPDGRRIAFWRLGYRGGLGVIELTTGRVTTLAVRGLDPEFLPLSWSPDGRWIAYTNARGENFDLMAVRFHDGKRRSILRNIPQVRGIDWTDRH